MSGSDGIKEARRLCWILAALNYDGQRTLVRPDSFDKPNFELVCHLLSWFAKIVDYDEQNLTVKRSPSSHTSQSQTGGASFLIGMGKVFANRLGVKLDLVALYRAERESCCPELLKVAEPIYQAAEVFAAALGNKKNQKNNMLNEPRQQVAASAKKQMELILRQFNGFAQVVETEEERSEKEEEEAKGLSAAVSQLAGELDELLASELGFNEERLKVMDRRLEVAEIEVALGTAHGDLVVKTRELARANGELAGDLLRLDERLNAKELEINEARERLNDLLLKAPAYVEKYEKLYKDYELAYMDYVSKYRNLIYLKSCCYDNHGESATPSGESIRLAPTVGGGAAPVPPRLLESLLEEAGASKPTSASSTVLGPATGRGVGGAAAGTTRITSPLGLEGDAGAGEYTGRRPEAAGERAGRRLDAAGLGKAEAGDGLGLEIEELLSEFGADGDEDEEKDSKDDESGDGGSDEDVEGLMGSF